MRLAAPLDKVKAATPFRFPVYSCRLPARPHLARCSPAMTNKPAAPARRKKLEVYVPNPLLDHFLTVLFGLMIAFVVKVLYDEPQRQGDVLPPLVLFGLFLLGCSAFIFIVKFSSLYVADRINAVLLALGLVDKAPIIGKAQIRKWQDQSWQLVIHVTMTAAEVYLLTVDAPGLWSDMSLAWTPDPRLPTFQPSFLLSRFYLFQLVRWMECTCNCHGGARARSPCCLGRRCSCETADPCCSPPPCRPSGP